MLKTLYAIYVVSANSFVPLPVVLRQGETYFEQNVCENVITIVKRDFDSGVYGPGAQNHSFVCLPVYFKDAPDGN